MSRSADSASPWLIALNQSDPPDASLLTELHACCAAESWRQDILAGRPYDGQESLLRASDAAIAHLDVFGLTQALAAHPRIGERPAQVNRTEAAWSRSEQSGMSEAGNLLRDQIAEANRRYEEHFNQVYLVCATGLSAEQLLASCLSRLGNDDATERDVVLGELAKIVRIRLARLLHADAVGASQ
jgi:2-oxo-4-hydroxy-4-carboxy-5-ureidoimidazoline decarboxylase